MADFCKECSEEMFDKDFKELAGLQGEDKEKFPVVICEGCGPIQVDNEGKCISRDCEKHGTGLSAA